MKSNCCKQEIIVPVHGCGLSPNGEPALFPYMVALCSKCYKQCNPAIRKQYSRPIKVHINKKKEIPKFNKREIWFD